jgi:predicted kinase
MAPPLEIRIPVPALVVLAGAAGSGKSTFAARHFAAGDVLSSDAFRARIAGDPTDQAATRPAFAALHRELRRRLAAGRPAVVDATSVSRPARATLLREARAAGVAAFAIVLDLPPDVVLDRNRTRDGRFAVPDDALRHHQVALARSLRDGRLAGEGFARAWRLRTEAEVNAARVVLEAGPPDR